MNIGERLKEERKRLLLRQNKICELLEITTVSYNRYEKNLTTPPATFLEKIYTLGFDIQYVVTGVRNTQGTFTQKEKLIINNYRESSEEMKSVIDNILKI